MAFLFAREQTLVGQKRRQQLLVFALVGISVVIAGVIWFGFFKTPSTGPLGVFTVAPAANKLEIDFGVLENKIFDTLEALPPSVPLPATIGRSNPFIPL